MLLTLAAAVLCLALSLAMAVIQARESADTSSPKSGPEPS